jgi:hypothetical protein
VDYTLFLRSLKVERERVGPFKRFEKTVTPPLSA